jgi:hypothetical protein
MYIRLDTLQAVKRGKYNLLVHKNHPSHNYYHKYYNRPEDTWMDML